MWIPLEQSRASRDTVNATIGDPVAAMDVDLITFDYPVSMHDAQTLGMPHAVADDIASLRPRRAAGQGEPTMVVGLSVDSNDKFWNGSEFLNGGQFYVTSEATRTCSTL